MEAAAAVLYFEALAWIAATPALRPPPTPPRQSRRRRNASDRAFRMAAPRWLAETAHYGHLAAQLGRTDRRLRTSVGQNIQAVYLAGKERRLSGRETRIRDRTPRSAARQATLVSIELPPVPRSWQPGRSLDWAPSLVGHRWHSGRQSSRSTDAGESTTTSQTTQFRQTKREPATELSFGDRKERRLEFMHSCAGRANNKETTDGSNISHLSKHL